MTEKRELHACSLDPEQLSARVAQWRAVASRATTRVIDRHRLISTYPREELLERQLRHLIAAEAQCCSFMQFDVAKEPQRLVVTLTVPPEMSDSLLAFFEGHDPRPDAPGAQEVSR